MPALLSRSLRDPMRSRYGARERESFAQVKRGRFPSTRGSFTGSRRGPISPHVPCLVLASILTWMTS
jgi:hypothetical protein